MMNDVRSKSGTKKPSAVGCPLSAFRAVGIHAALLGLPLKQKYEIEDKRCEAISQGIMLLVSTLKNVSPAAVSVYSLVCKRSPRRTNKPVPRLRWAGSFSK